MTCNPDHSTKMMILQERAVIYTVQYWIYYVSKYVYIYIYIYTHIYTMYAGNTGSSLIMYSVEFTATESILGWSHLGVLRSTRQMTLGSSSRVG